jgi:hypothetical protein
VGGSDAFIIWASFVEIEKRGAAIMERLLKAGTIILMLVSFILAAVTLIFNLERFVLVLGLITFGLAALLVPLIEGKWGWQKQR